MSTSSSLASCSPFSSTHWSGEQRGRVGRLHAILWTGAGATALTAHAAVVAWMLYQPPMEMADNAPLPAIMIELAANPEAINTEMNEISPDQENAEASEAQHEQPVETAKPEDVPEPVEQPVEETAEEEPVEQQVLTQLENVEVPLPVMRSQPVEREKPAEQPKPKKIEQKKAPPRQQASTASQARIQAAAQVTQSNRNAANQSVAGMGLGSVSPAKWQQRLMAHLERRKRYPSAAKSRGERGVVYVRFRIDDAGNVLSASLARSSGFAELDAEVVALVKRASPVPTPPPGVNRTITAPVRFDIR